MSRAILALFSFLLSTDFVAAKTWLCVADQAVGFKPTESQWDYARFKTDNKYIVKPIEDRLLKYLSGPYLELKYGITEFGKSGPSYCSPHMLYKDSWECGDVLFSKETLRFIRFFAGGYVHSFQNSDTPYLEIGKCTAIEE